MRGSLIVVFQLFVALLVSSCATQSITVNNGQPHWVMLNQSLKLSDAEIRDLEPKALGGSTEAALRLCNFFDFIRMDHNEAMFWVQIAAENGGHISEYNYGSMLYEDPNPRNRQRARFWLERAAKNGDEKAKILLRKLTE
jgi:TPR repeat protein